MLVTNIQKAERQRIDKMENLQAQYEKLVKEFNANVHYANKLRAQSKDAQNLKEKLELLKCWRAANDTATASCRAMSAFRLKYYEYLAV
jgi:hypothetical protein